MNPNALQDVDNEVLRSADEYLRQHKILDLFEDLTTLVCYRKLDSQDELKTFLCEQIEQRKAHGPRSIVFSDSELQNIFTLYDLKGMGQITKEQCREALKTLANSEFHFTKA